ncbi:hypothetical protein [Mesorhizobium sp. M7A.F.Ca.CA.002.05.1.1]|uniref:hypothetical protein n=1 Tax=Mesorhizobium sp. M7A.F.Ca.CA.002.05.1.1 TaxID=2496704 RepID=UPI0013E317CD|nr:hypothetical protein [Mesorhizobium sp. M7A.F.Ca.CA.002.05.1.1]
MPAVDYVAADAYINSDDTGDCQLADLIQGEELPSLYARSCCAEQCRWLAPWL